MCVCVPVRVYVYMCVYIFNTSLLFYVHTAKLVPLAAVPVPMGTTHLRERPTPACPVRQVPPVPLPRPAPPPAPRGTTPLPTPPPVCCVRGAARAWTLPCPPQCAPRANMRPPGASRGAWRVSLGTPVPWREPARGTSEQIDARRSMNMHACEMHVGSCVRTYIPNMLDSCTCMWGNEWYIILCISTHSCFMCFLRYEYLMTIRVGRIKINCWGLDNKFKILLLTFVHILSAVACKG